MSSIVRVQHFDKPEDAGRAAEALNGWEFQGKVIRVEVSSILLIPWLCEYDPGVCCDNNEASIPCRSKFTLAIVEIYNS
jgi:hypothetical protein